MPNCRMGGRSDNDSARKPLALIECSKQDRAGRRSSMACCSAPVGLVAGAAFLEMIEEVDLVVLGGARGRWSRSGSSRC